MFRPIPAIIRFSSERVLVFIRFMRLCNDGEISSSVVLIITTIKRRGWEGGGVLLTKYLYLFIYTHNGDGTFQNRHTYTKNNTFVLMVVLIV